MTTPKEEMRLFETSVLFRSHLQELFPELLVKVDSRIAEAQFETQCQLLFTFFKLEDKEIVDGEVIYNHCTIAAQFGLNYPTVNNINSRFPDLVDEIEKKVKKRLEQ